MKTGMLGKNKGYIFIIIAVSLWSTIEVFSKLLDNVVPPFTIAFIRFLLGTLVLFLFLWKENQIILTKNAIDHNFKKFFIMGSVGITMTFTLLQLSITMTKASIAAAVFGSIPLFVMILSFIFLKQSIKLNSLIGIFIGLFGIFLVVLNFNYLSLLLFSSDYLSGNFLALVSAITWSTYAIIGRNLIDKYGSLIVVFISFCMSLPSLFFVTLFFEGTTIFDISRSSWMILLWLGIFTVALGYYLFFRGLSYVDTSKGMSLYFIKPPLSWMLASVLIQESISSGQIFGVFLISLGIFITFFMEKRDKVRSIGS